MNIKCVAALSEKQKLIPHEYSPDALGDFDIDVKITHCGICYSDVHLIDNDWGISEYPLIPGHEIVGSVTEVGLRVDKSYLGKRVGIGWQRSSCMECEWCHQGEENLCAKQEATCVNHPGGFSEYIRVDSRFSFIIPDGISSEVAAPLLCGGATVYSPLIDHNITSNSKVGVIGIGGLGHLALQFAKALGARVTALSTSQDKEKESKAFGADQFIYVKDPKQFEINKGQFDFLLSTVHSPSIVWEDYLNLLRPKGVLCFVGVPTDKLALPAFSLIAERKVICGSNIASRLTLKLMLQFSAKNNVKAKVEVFPLLEVNKAIQKLRDGQMKYRAVLKV